MNEEEQQQMPQVRSSPYMSPMYNYGSGIVLLTNPKDEIYNIELALRSVFETRNGEYLQVGEPLLNDVGIKSVIGQVQAIVNKITVMGWLENPEIMNLIDGSGDTMIKDLMINRKKYNINSLSTRDKIMTQTMTTAYLTMKRAYKEGDRRFWKGSVQEVRTTFESEQKKKGLFGLWKK